MRILPIFAVFFFINCDGVFAPPKGLKKCESCIGSTFSGAGVVGDTFPDGNSFQLNTANVANYRGFCGDFDKSNRVFVIVYGNGPVGGLFLDDNGNQVGGGFTLPTVTTAWSQLPRVACANDGSCMAVWHDGRSGAPVVWGRIIRFSGGSAVMGADFQIGTPSWQEAPPGIAFSPEAGEYLVSWNNNNLYAQRVGIDGALRGGTLTISGDGIWTEQSSIAYSPVGRNFAVITMKSTAGNAAQIYFRSVTAGTGAMGGPIILENMAGGKITDLEWDSGAGKFFGGWFNGGGFSGAIFNSDGSNVILNTIYPGFSSYDGFDMAYNAHTQTIFSTFHGHSAEDWGGELDRQFQNGSVYEVTNISPANGAFVPKIVAHPFKPFWIVITTRDYGALFAQKIIRQ